MANALSRGVTLGHIAAAVSVGVKCQGNEAERRITSQREIVGGGGEGRARD